jgi:hypothetical protein
LSSISFSLSELYGNGNVVPLGFQWRPLNQDHRDSKQSGTPFAHLGSIDPVFSSAMITLPYSVADILNI